MERGRRGGSRVVEDDEVGGVMNRVEMDQHTNTKAAFSEVRCVVKGP